MSDPGNADASASLESTEPTYLPGQDTQPEVNGFAWSGGVAILVGLLYLFLIAFQYTGVPRLAFMVGEKWILSKYIASLFGVAWSVLDLALISGIAIVFITLIWIEYQSGRVTGFLDRVFDNETSSVLFTSVTCLVAVRYYFSIGLMTWGGDGAFHTLYAWISAEGFASGTIPVWTPLVSAGTPFLQFYGFTFFYITGFLNLFVDNIEFTLKAVLGLSHAASGLTCYLYVRTITDSRKAGFFAAVCYVLSFWHLQQILIMGRFPVSLVYLALPLPFYAFERLRRKKGNHLAVVVLGAVSIGFLFFTHPGYAFWSVFFLVGYVLVAGRSGDHMPWLATVAMVVGGLALASYLVVPMWIERGFTNLREGVDLTSLQEPSLNQLLVWSNRRTRLFPLPATADHWYGGYLGLTPILLSLYGLITWIRRRGMDPARYFSLIGLTVSLFFVFGSRLPVLVDFPPLKAMGSGRFLVFVVFFLSVSGAVGYEAIAQQTRWRSTLFALLALVSIDLGSTTFRQPYHFIDDRSSLPGLQDIYDELMAYQRDVPENQFVPGRILCTHVTENNFIAKIGRFPTIANLYHEHPRTAGEFISPFFDRLKSDLSGTTDEAREHIQSEQGRVAYHALYLLNTRYFLHRSTSLGEININLDQASPIVVSNRLAYPDIDSLLTAPDRAYQMVYEMGLVPSDGRCERILVTTDRREALLPGTPVVELIDHQVWVDRTSFRFTVTHDAFARLSYGYYPFLDITLDGQPVDYFPTAEGFIGLAVPAGAHSIAIGGKLSPLRKVLLVVLLLAGGLIVCLGVYRGRTDRHPCSPAFRG